MLAARPSPELIAAVHAETCTGVLSDLEPLAVRKELLERFDLEIGGGLGAYAATVRRIGLMEPDAAPDRVALVLAAPAEVLGR